jgi:hypothetical protein
MMSKYSFDPNNMNSTFIYDVYSELWGNHYYEVRPAMSFSVFGGFTFKDVMMGSDHDSLVSVPMYCKMAGISVNEVEYESVKIKIKWYYNHIDFERFMFTYDYEDAF